MKSDKPAMTKDYTKTDRILLLVQTICKTPKLTCYFLTMFNRQKIIYIEVKVEKVACYKIDVSYRLRI